MKERIDEEIVRYLWWLRPVVADEAAPRRRAARRRAAAPLDPERPGAEPASAVRRRAARPRRRRRRGGRAARAAAGARRRRRRDGQDGAARRAEGRPQRSVPVRQRQEVQEVPRRRSVSCRTATWTPRTPDDRPAGAIDGIADLATALTFDDVLLVPQHSTVLPSQVDVTHAAHAQHPAERAARQRGHGHGHRVAAGHRHGAARRPRRHPQEPVDRGAGVRGRPREAVGERHDRRSDHALARRTGSTKRSS